MANQDILDRDPDPFAKTLQGGQGLLAAEESDLPGPTLVGFFGRGEGTRRRLYLATGAYIEFEADDVVAYADVPPEESPVLGQQATSIRLKRLAQVDYIHVRPTEKLTPDEFAPEVRFHRLPAEYVESVAFGYPRTFTTTLHPPHK
jgi:hypothetical protein